MAQEALRQLLEHGTTDADADAAAALLARVDAGFRLHGRGPRGAALLAGFDANAELLAMLAAKTLPADAAGAAGAALPQVGGRALSAWLSGHHDSATSAALLAALESEGWLVRGGALETSRLWRLIDTGDAVDAADADEVSKTDGDDAVAAAPLAGVFSAYELALLADWVAGGSAGASQNGALRRASVPAAPPRVRESAERGIIRHRFPDDEHGWEAIANELSLLEARVVASASKEEAIALLASLMAPSNHHTSTGLMATRMFSKLFTS